MTRRRLHTLDELLDVAEGIVTSADPAGLTLRALGAAAGASNGTSCSPGSGCVPGRGSPT